MFFHCIRRKMRGSARGWGGERVGKEQLVKLLRKEAMGESQPLGTLAFHKEAEPLLNIITESTGEEVPSLLSLARQPSLQCFLLVRPNQAENQDAVQVILRDHPFGRAGRVRSKSEEAMKTSSTLPAQDPVYSHTSNFVLFCFRPFFLSYSLIFSLYYR